MSKSENSLDAASNGQLVDLLRAGRSFEPKVSAGEPLLAETS